MSQTMILTGDVNLMNVTEPKVSFRQVRSMFRAADVVFSNMECCLYMPAGRRAVENEGFFAAPVPAGKALKYAGIQAVGIANNVNYGEAAITSSVARLDKLGIPHAGAGAGRDAAHAPVILKRNGTRFGFLQRTSVYWPTNHEAAQNAAGVAVIRAHTAYQLPLHKTRREVPPCNRPGLPPTILTWADAAYLQKFKDDIAALRAKTDIVVASCHWGLNEDPLQYMIEIAHAAIDAGADVVMGHGPHVMLPVEVYKGKPIYYGLGRFSFHSGHHAGKAPGDWVGMMARLEIEKRKLRSAAFQFVRHNQANETVPCVLANEQPVLADMVARSARLGVKLEPRGDQVFFGLGRATAKRSRQR